MGGRAHKEAFCLMHYECEGPLFPKHTGAGCGHREIIWNARDGVTPFGGVPCPSCGGFLTHVDFKSDAFRPEHKLRDGQRFFRDGTADDAVAIIERRIAAFTERGMPPPPDVAESLRAAAREGRDEFRPGWPVCDRFTANTKVTAALKVAIGHIEHMAAFIAANTTGYSFEALGEDMSIIRGPLSNHGEKQ